MVYDGTNTTDGSVIMFGGSSAGGDLNDTWQFAGGQWTQQSPTNAPPARDSFGMAYDLARKGVLVFGGFEPSGACGTEVGDSWLYSGGNWTQLSPGTSPPARQGAAMTDELRNNGVIVLFGGVSGTCGAHPTYLRRHLGRGSDLTWLRAPIRGRVRRIRPESRILKLTMSSYPEMTFATLMVGVVDAALSHQEAGQLIPVARTCGCQ